MSSEMAPDWKRKRWQYRLKICGKVCHGSVKASSKAQAECFLNLLRTKVHKESTEAANHPTFAELAGSCLQQNPRLSAVSKLNMQRFVNKYAIPVLGDLDFTKIGQQHLEELATNYLNVTSIQHRPHCLGGLRCLLAYVSSILNWGRRHFHIEECQVAKVVLPNLKQKVSNHIPTHLIEPFRTALFACATNQQVYLAVHLMVFHGLRPAEIIGMTWDRFSGNYSTYSLVGRRGLENRLVQIQKGLVEQLKTWKAVATTQCARVGMPLPPFVFFRARSLQNNPTKNSQDNELWQPQNPRFCDHCIQKAGQAIGIARKLSPHHLRSTYALLLAEAGVPLTLIKAMLRMSSNAKLRGLPRPDPEKDLHAVRRIVHFMKDPDSSFKLSRLPPGIFPGGVSPS